MGTRFGGLADAAIRTRLRAKIRSEITGLYDKGHRKRNKRDKVAVVMRPTVDSIMAGVDSTSLATIVNSGILSEDRIREMIQEEIDSVFPKPAYVAKPEPLEPESRLLGES